MKRKILVLLSLVLIICLSLCFFIACDDDETPPTTNGGTSSGDVDDDNGDNSGNNSGDNNGDNAGGDSGNTGGDTGHTCVFDQAVDSEENKATSATCVSKATYYYTCTCGEKGTLTFESGDLSLTHDYNAWVSQGDDTHKRVCKNSAEHFEIEDCNGGVATCVQKATCLDCNTAWGDFDDHHFDQRNTDEKYLIEKATCQHAEMYYFSCVCGEKGTEPFSIGDVSPYHNFVEGICKDCNEYQTKGLWYIKFDDQNVSVQIDDCEDSEIFIASTYQGAPVTIITGGGFSYKEKLTKVHLPSTIKTIGSGAFQYCHNLISIEIPASVENIYSDAFRDCYRLVEVINYSSHFEITKTTGENGQYGYLGEYAHRIVNTNEYCPSAIVTDSNGLMTITSGNDKILFALNKPMTELIVPDDITKIGNHFLFCNKEAIKKLQKVVISNSVTEICDNAFDNCYALTEVIIGDGVTKIGENAFLTCESIATLTLGKNVTEIGEDAFCLCYRLVEIINKSNLVITKESGANGANGYLGENALTISNKDDNYVSKVSIEDEFVIIRLDNEVILVEYNGVLTELTLPTGITKINNYAFYNGSGFKAVVTKLTIPNSVKNIGYKAFSYCRFNEISIPNSITEIGSYAFSDCVELRTVIVGTGVNNIGSSAFEGCNKLSEVINKSNLTFVEGSSDNGYIAYYASVVSNNESDYTESKIVTDANGFLTITHGQEVILIGYSGTATNLVLPSGITKIGTRAFYCNSNIVSITFSSTVKTVNNRAFYSCSSLKTVTINVGLETLDDYVFSYCSKLTSVNIPASVTKIGKASFYKCTAMNSVSININYSGWYYTTSSNYTGGSTLSYYKNFTDYNTYYYYKA
ncbi:MAG: leucine-rich repeat domain-containing protein [Clostridia bacterium]|nr:leucine-rich repeat domain-containing protein [Clostridia bacterium]